MTWELYTPGRLRLVDTSIEIHYSPEWDRPFLVYHKGKFVPGNYYYEYNRLAAAKAFILTELIPNLVEMGMEP